MVNIEINRKTFKFEDRISWLAHLEKALAMKSFDIVVHAKNDSFFFQMFRDGGKDCLLQCRAEDFQREASLPEIKASQALEWIDLYCLNDGRFEKVIAWNEMESSRLTDEEKAFYKKLTWGKSTLLDLVGFALGGASFFFMSEQDLLARMPDFKALVSAGFLLAAAILSYEFRWKWIHYKKMGVPFWDRDSKAVAIIFFFLMLAPFPFLPSADWFSYHQIMERRRQRGQKTISYEEWRRPGKTQHSSLRRGAVTGDLVK